MRCTDLLNSGMFTPHVLYLFSWTLDDRLQSKNSFPEVKRLGETHPGHQVFLYHGSIRPTDEMAMIEAFLVHAGCCCIDIARLDYT